MTLRTDDESFLWETLQSRSVILRNSQHALDPLARPFLAEHHLEDCGVNRLA